MVFAVTLPNFTLARTRSQFIFTRSYIRAQQARHCRSAFLLPPIIIVHFIIVWTRRGGGGVAKMLGEAAGAEVIAQRAEAEGEAPAFGSENAAVPAAEAKLLDASTLQPGESLAGRDLQGWTLRGDFSGRDFDGADLRRAVARCANFRNASMRDVDASRADFRGASLAGVAVHGAKFRRAKCQRARMAGMWSVGADERPEVKAGKDGTMPPMEPLETTHEWAVEWAEEEATPVDTVKDGEEDAQDEAAWAAHVQAVQDTYGFEEEHLVDMQHMHAM